MSFYERKGHMRATEGSRIHKVKKIEQKRVISMSAILQISEMFLKKIRSVFFKNCIKIRVNHFSIINGSKSN